MPWNQFNFYHTIYCEIMSYHPKPGNYLLRKKELSFCSPREIESTTPCIPFLTLARGMRHYYSPLNCMGTSFFVNKSSFFLTTSWFNPTIQNGNADLQFEIKYTDVALRMFQLFTAWKNMTAILCWSIHLEWTEKIIWWHHHA